MRALTRLNYYAEGFGYYFMPDFVSNWHYHKKRDRFSKKQQEEIETRADYYVRLPHGSRIINADSFSIGEFRYPFGQENKHTGYFLDIYPFLRQHRPELVFNYVNEDIDVETPLPAFVKSRPVTTGPTNSVLSRLNSLRHFRFIKDSIPFHEKDDIIVSRNYVCQPWRIDLLEKYFNHPLCDFGQINTDGGKPEWIKPYLSIQEQLRHKFIMCIRGNDVATNLKWVMSSNSIAVMPRPDVESWFMEGLLIPDFHYIEIKPDYSDLIEKTRYFATHKAESEAIIRNAHEWVDRFRNKSLEYAVMEEVVKRYFHMTGQL